MSTVLATYNSITPIHIGNGALEKAAGIVRAYPEIWNGAVVDVGCRWRELEQALEGRPVTYLGLDLYPPADIVADVTEGIPLPDDHADVVVALDVLEHLDKIHEAFAELCRIASDHVIIALPNAYRLRKRWDYVRGDLAAKYGLPDEPPTDRHRWLFSFDDARRFCRYQAEKASWRVADEAVLIGPRRRRIEPLVRAWPNLYSPSLIAHLVPAA